MGGEAAQVMQVMVDPNLKLEDAIQSGVAQSLAPALQRVESLLGAKAPMRRNYFLGAK